MPFGTRFIMGTLGKTTFMKKSMGDKFNSLIESLNDHELAVYVGYQYEGLLNSSREKVKNEISSRNLTKTKLEKYLNSKLKYNEEVKCCEKCGSNKFYKDIDIEYKNKKYSTTELEVQTNRCRLCNYNPSKVTEKNIFKRIKQYFVEDNNRTTKFIKTYNWLD